MKSTISNGYIAISSSAIAVVSERLLFAPSTLWSYSLWLIPNPNCCLSVLSLHLEMWSIRTTVVVDDVRITTCSVRLIEHAFSVYWGICNSVHFCYNKYYTFD